MCVCVWECLCCLCLKEAVRKGERRVLEQGEEDEVEVGEYHQARRRIGKAVGFIFSTS